MQKLSIIFTSLALSGAVYAQSIDSNQIQYGLSGLWTNMNGNHFSAGLALQNKAYEMGVSANLQHTKKYQSKPSETEYGIGAYAGIRHSSRNSQHIWGSLGLMGATRIVSPKDSDDQTPYAIGAYLGLAYQPTDDAKLFIRWMPFSYEETPSGRTQFEFFEEGQMGITWFFN